MATTHGDFAPWLGVFETLRVIDGVPLFVAEHRAELARAMKALGLGAAFDAQAVRTELPPRSGRWRWIATSDGVRTMFTEEAPVVSAPLALSVSPVRVGSQNWDARFKTVSYLVHAQAAATASTPEVVVLNEQGNVASAARSNIFWRRGDRLYTPAHEAGCRCGVVRGFVLKNVPVEEGYFPLAHVLEAEEIFLTNSIKGLVSVNMIEGRALADFSAAESLHAKYDAEIVAQVKAG